MIFYTIPSHVFQLLLQHADWASRQNLRRDKMAPILPTKFYNSFSGMIYWCICVTWLQWVQSTWWKQMPNPLLENSDNILPGRIELVGMTLSLSLQTDYDYAGMKPTRLTYHNALEPGPNQSNTSSPGARPTNDISIEFEIRPKFVVL